MKKILAIVVLAFSSTSVMAASYGSAGCGLGSLAFQKNDMTQVLAATTNGTFGSQTFGMTSGTSNCNNQGLVKLSMTRASYIEANYKDISKDVAKGNGEYLDNLATLYGYIGNDAKDFAKLLQNNYKKIFSSNNAKVALNEINSLTGNM